MNRSNKDVISKAIAWVHLKHFVGVDLCWISRPAQGKINPSRFFSGTSIQLDCKESIKTDSR